MGTVYLIHFERPVRHAQHYIGWTGLELLDTRIERHRAGNGSKLMAHVEGLGIGWSVARTWEGDRGMERRLKKRRNARELCPVCKEAKRKAANRLQQARRRAR